MKVYAIYSPKLNKYYNYLTSNLDELGSGTKFYRTKENAERKINGYFDERCGRITGSIDIELAWKAIEKNYNDDRWNIDISHKEFFKICDSFKDLKVVEIEISPSLE